MVLVEGRQCDAIQRSIKFWHFNEAWAFSEPGGASGCREAGPHYPEWFNVYKLRVDILSFHP